MRCAVAAVVVVVAAVVRTGVPVVLGAVGSKPEAPKCRRSRRRSSSAPFSPSSCWAMHLAIEVYV